MSCSFARAGTRAARILFGCALMALLGPACAQTGGSDEALRREIEELKKQQAETQRKLDELIETLQPILERLPKPFRPQRMSFKGSPVKGEPSAKVTLVEFTDLQCPFCVRYYKNTFPRIVKDFVETGKVRYVAREFPLASIHKDAQRAAQAALCAGEQGKYWELRDKIFHNRSRLAPEHLEEYARAVGVEIEPWKACLESGRYNEKVARDVRDGSRLGVNGTPSFAFGLTDPDDPESITVQDLIQGAYPYEEFARRINKLLD
ncbi:MAG TPA: hypothetical protein ENJ62_05840 [Bryobacterales bacterium]|nr:hypothetical protein [Bryobacterales bacterium]